MPQNPAVPETVAREAAEWVLRCDRGLTPTEQDDFSAWLAADPRHGAQLARHRRHWNRLDQLAQWLPEHSTRPNPDLLAPPLRRRVVRFVPATLMLAAAAAVAAVFFWSASRPAAPAPGSNASVAAAAAANDALAASRARVLEDGSIVELNRGAELSVHFTPGERRVKLERGEAHFAVSKDPARPFIVNAHGIDVRAVGTAFNVRLDSASVEVLVTEGKVSVGQDPATAASPSVGPAFVGGASATSATDLVLIPQLTARQRAVVSTGARHPGPQIATLTVGEIDRVLAWQHRLLDFNDKPLSEVVTEFNRRNVRQIVVIDPALAAEKISVRFRSDNIDSFLGFLETGFSARVERRSETEIVVSRGR